MSKIVVIGAAGFVGSNICSALKDQNEIIGVTRDGSSYMDGIKHATLDLSNKENIKHFLEKHTPDSIVYAAGIHGVPQCAGSPKDCDIKNHVAAVNIVEIADRSMIPCVYISNAYSVGYGNGDLEREPIGFDDPASPESNYGKSKLQAEDFYIARTKVGFVIRSGMLIGRGSGHTLTFWETVEKFLSNSQPIKLRKDLVHGWTAAFQLGEAIMKLSEQVETREESERMVQLSSKDECSPYELAQKYCEMMEYDKSLVELLPETAKEKERWSPDFNKAEKCLNTYSLEPSGNYQLNPQTGNELLESGEYTVKEMLESYLSRLQN